MNLKLVLFLSLCLDSFMGDSKCTPIKEPTVQAK